MTENLSVLNQTFLHGQDFTRLLWRPLQTVFEWFQVEIFFNSLFQLFNYCCHFLNSDFWQVCLLLTDVLKSQNLSIKVLTFRSMILSIINTNICYYYELVKKFSKFGWLLILLNVGKLIPKHRKTHYYGLVPSKILFTVHFT